MKSIKLKAGVDVPVGVGGPIMTIPKGTKGILDEDIKFGKENPVILDLGTFKLTVLLKPSFYESTLKEL